MSAEIVTGEWRVASRVKQSGIDYKGHKGATKEIHQATGKTRFRSDANEESGTEKIRPARF
jgi:hypothetical protein